MRTAHFLCKDKTFTQDLSGGALSYTTDYGRARKIEEISINFSVAVSETITITLDSKNGSSYDVVKDSVTLVAEQDYVFRPNGEFNLNAGDEVKVQCTNANLTGSAFGVIRASEM
jgi:hypothetical protein